MLTEFSILTTGIPPHLLHDEAALRSYYEFCIFLLNFVSFWHYVLKVFRVLCYSKLTFEWLPIINPYVWPFSAFEILTSWYFRLSIEVLPPLKFEKSSFEISAILALEALNSLIYFCVKVSNYLIPTLDEIQKILYS